MALVGVLLLGAFLGGFALIQRSGGRGPEETRSGAGVPDLDSVETIIDELNARGIECSGRRVFTEVATEDFEAGLCYAMDREFEVDIYSYSSRELRTINLRELRRVYDREVVVGTTWYLTTGDPALSRRIAVALGGRVVDPRR